MTENRFRFGESTEKTRQKKIRISKILNNGFLSAGRICWGSGCLLLISLWLKNPKWIQNALQEGLAVCAQNLIPALFPFLVLSDLLNRSEFLQRIKIPFSEVLQKLFRLSASGLTAWLMGMLCGFPVGAIVTVTGVKRGSISKEEGERLLCFCGNPSPAFLIGVIGDGIFGDVLIGKLLLGIVWLSEILTALISARSKKAKESPVTDRFFSISDEEPNGNGTFAIAFRESVASALQSVLLICSYVLFFSAVNGSLRLTLNALSCPQTLSSFLLCVTELSGGVFACKALSPEQAIAFAGFAVGWSGLAVHCQMLSICQDSPLRLHRYIFAKLLQGIFCSAFALMLFILLP